MHNRSLVLLVVLSAATSSCWYRKTPAVFTPPPAQARPQNADAKEPPLLPPPPDIEGDRTATLPPELPETMPPPVEPPKPPPAPRRGTVATTPPKPAPPPPAPAPETPPPKLGQIFTADQLREYNRALDESLDRVRKTLAVVAGKTLTAEQVEIAERIRTFQRQAEQAREQDLVTAVSLARRADLLAKDLLGRLP